MPLTKDMSFEEIVKKEVAAGKTQKEAVAIAYSVKGENKKNKNGNEGLTWQERIDLRNDKLERGKNKYGSSKKENVKYMVVDDMSDNVFAQDLSKEEADAEKRRLQKDRGGKFRVEIDK